MYVSTASKPRIAFTTGVVREALKAAPLGIATAMERLMSSSVSVIVCGVVVSFLPLLFQLSGVPVPDFVWGVVCGLAVVLSVIVMLRSSSKNRELVTLLGSARAELAAAKSTANTHQETIARMSKDRDLLLKEVYHRVKNNLQVILSIFNLQVRRVTDPAVKTSLQEATNRIRVISLLHQTLYQSESFSDIDVGVYVREIVRALDPVGEVKFHPKLSLNSSISPLSIEKAIPLGLIITELVTNSLKYAWNAEVIAANGEPSLTIDIRDPDDTGLVTLEYADNGQGFSQEFDLAAASSLGSKLIVILSKQLKGIAQIDRSAPLGARVTVQFPIRAGVEAFPV